MDGVGGQRILVVDDHRLVSESLATVLAGRGFEARAVNQIERDAILAQAGQFRPAIVLLDLQLAHDLDGTSLVEPLTVLNARVLMMTGVTDPAELGRCLEAGAEGVISKGQPFDDLIDQIASAVAGERVLPVTRAEQLLDELRRDRAERQRQLEPFECLTPRERELLDMLSAGRPAAAIADFWYVSLATVRSHIRSLLSKLDVHSQLEAVAKARESGWAQD
jgi:two-component system nitrate/nitrite response regulator NarL